MQTIGDLTIQYNRQGRAWEVGGGDKSHYFQAGPVGKQAAIKFAIQEAFPEVATAVDQLIQKNELATGRAWAAAQLLIGKHLLVPDNDAEFHCIARVVSQQNGRCHHWSVANGIAQPEAVFLVGDSYGGYLTLQALGKRPELWAGGMAGMAIADWVMIYEDASDRMRGHQRIVFGGTPEDKPEVYKKSSPITYAEHVQAPILAIQGSNDSRCTPRQMQAYEAKLKSLGKQIEIHWFEAGHGSQAQEQQIEHQEQKMRFAYRVLENPLPKGG